MQDRKNNVGGLRSTKGWLMRGCVVLLAVVCACLPAAAQTTQFVELGSVVSGSTQSGNGRSDRPTMSDDGRFIVFESSAGNLVPHDTNDVVADIFVRDSQLGTTQLVSVNMAGTGSGLGHSSAASITPDGRFVLFRSDADDLVPNDTNNATDVFVRDLVTQTTKLVNLNAAGTASGNGGSFGGVITPDGRYVAFTSSAGDLLATPGQPSTAPFTNVFRRDLQTNTTVLVSVNAAGTGPGNGTSSASAITPDGRFVLFSSVAGDLTSNDTNGAFDIFRRDLQTNTTALASVNSAGTASGNTHAFRGVMSDDGQVVAFESGATDLVPPGGAGTGFTSPSVYVRDFAANTTTLVSEMQVFQAGLATVPPAQFPRISADGRYVFYLRLEVASGGLNRPVFRDRVFRRDRVTNELLELPFVATGVCAQGFNCISRIDNGTSYVTSRDGRYVAYSQFERARSNPTPFSTAIIVRDMVGGGTEVVVGMPGVPFSFTPPQDYLIPGAVVTGGKLAFASGVNHLPADANASVDVYRYSPPAGTRFVFNRASYNVIENGTVPPLQTVEVRRVGYLIDSPATVKFATSNGSAEAGSDYAARSETLSFAPGESARAVSVDIVNDSALENDETINLTLSEPTGNATLGAQSSASLVITDDDLHTLQFGSATYEVNESDSSVLISVTLAGVPRGPFTVDYRTSDGTASERSDYITAYGRLHFAEGETSKSFRVLIVDDAFVEPDETVNLTLSNPQGIGATLGPQSTAQLVIHSNDATPSASNPIDSSAFFVRQHYFDFLNREPDASGFTFWVNEIESCGANAQCREVKRINVSAAFFLSIEFQETGFLAYLTNKAALGARPSFAQFELEVQRLQRGFVFGQPGAPAQLEANKRAYFDEFVTRPEFTSKFNGTTNTQYVNTLLNENTLSTTIPDVFVARLEGQTPTPGTPPAVFILRRDPNNPANTTVRLSLRLNSLTSAPTAVHIHGPAADGAPVLYTLPAGEFSDRLLMLTSEQVNFLNTGRLTVDVHTQNNPNGELSAQLGPARFRADVLTNALNDQTLTRAQVLRIVAESDDLRAAEFNAAFVLMEYFGYLRRDPDQEGYNFWLTKLNQFNGDFVRAEMVKAFISSAEYRQRFGQ